MKGRSWTTLWPGLTGVCLRGSWLDLALAAAFAGALSLAVVTSLVWHPDLLKELPRWGVPAAAWVLVLWLGVLGHGRAKRLLALETAKSLQPDDVSETLLREAQTEYLRGHWLEAKALLVKLLTRRPGDAEARLLLVSVFRRSGQIEQATQQLAALAALPRGHIWREEIARERAKLAAAASFTSVARAA